MVSADSELPVDGVPQERLDEAKRRVAARVSDMDPGDVDLILRSLLRPFGTGRRFFLRELRPGVLLVRDTPHNRQKIAELGVRLGARSVARLRRRSE